MTLRLPGSRSQRGFERLYKRHVGSVYRYALAVMRTEVDAESVTVATFVNAYRLFRRGERPGREQSWLIGLAHSVCRQRCRQTDRGAREHAEPLLLAAPAAADLRRALARLPFGQRSALVMREVEGRSYAEIAEALATSAGTVETLLFRARRTLREQLAGLTCAGAGLAVSRLLDRRLPRAERAELRRHLEECDDCRRLGEGRRARRVAWKALGRAPLPAALARAGSCPTGPAEAPPPSSAAWR